MAASFLKIIILLFSGFVFINECFSQPKINRDDLLDKFKKTYCLSDLNDKKCEEKLDDKMKDVRLRCYRLTVSQKECNDRALDSVDSFLKYLIWKRKSKGRAPGEDISKRTIRKNQDKNWSDFVNHDLGKLDFEGIDKFLYPELEKNVVTNLKNEKLKLKKDLEDTREKLKKVKKSKNKNEKELEIALEKEKEAFDKVNAIEEVEENAESFVHNSLNLPRKKSCDQKIANFVPLKLLKDLTWNKKGIDISVKTDPKTKKKSLSVTMPDYIEKCFHPKVIVKKGEGNKILIAVQNLNQSINSGRESGIKRRFEKCISDELVDLKNPRGDHFHRPFKLKNYARDIDISNVDPSKDIRVVYGSPNNWNKSSYKPDPISDNNDKVTFRGEKNKCLEALTQENLKEGGLDLLGWKERKKQLYELCNKDLSFFSLTNVIKSLSDYPDELVSDVKAVLRSKLDKKSSEQMELLKEYGNEIANAETREEAKESLENYLNVLRDLDNFILRPSLKELEKLMSTRSNSKNRKEVDKRIKELNEIIGRFSKGKISKNGSEKELKTKDVLKKLLYFGLEDGANEINLYRLHSSAFSRVYKKGGRKKDKDKKQAKRLTHKAASKLVKNGQLKFEKGSSFNSKLYKAMNGEKSFSHINRSNIKNYQRRRQGMLKSFYEKEKKYASYCQRSFFGFIKNANKCKRFQKGQRSRYRRIQSMVSGMDKKINSEQKIEAQFRALENKARDKKREELGRSFKNIEDKAFSDRLMEDDFMEGIYKERLSFFGDVSEEDDPLKLFNENDQGEEGPSGVLYYPQLMNNSSLGLGNPTGGYYNPGWGASYYGIPLNSPLYTR